MHIKVDISIDSNKNYLDNTKNTWTRQSKNEFCDQGIK